MRNVSDDHHLHRIAHHQGARERRLRRAVLARSAVVHRRHRAHAAGRRRRRTARIRGWSGWASPDGTTDSGGTSTLVIVDDATNPQHPPQWFARSEEFACLCPAPFFSEELRVRGGARAAASGTPWSSPTATARRAGPLALADARARAAGCRACLESNPGGQPLVTGAAFPGGTSVTRLNVYADAAGGAADGLHGGTPAPAHRLDRGVHRDGRLGGAADHRPRRLPHGTSWQRGASSGSAPARFIVPSTTAGSRWP